MEMNNNVNTMKTMLKLCLYCTRDAPRNMKIIESDEELENIRERERHHENDSKTIYLKGNVWISIEQSFNDNKNARLRTSFIWAIT